MKDKNTKDITVKCTCTVTKAELWEILNGLKLILDKQFERISIQADSIEAVNVIQDVLVVQQCRTHQLNRATNDQRDAQTSTNYPTILVPVLDFRQTPSYYTDKKWRTSFRHLAYKALMLNKAASLLSPHLQHRSQPFISQHYDQRRNLLVRGSGNGHLDFHEMEIRVLRTAYLFILGLEFECSETQPRNLHRVRNYRSGRLSSLKVLHLRSVAYANNKSVSKLLQGCTVLEELIVKRTFKDNAKNLIVHVPTLKTVRQDEQITIQIRSYYKCPESWLP
ncbi:hypothetical protein J1N35_004088 [Gossypium stocksii]|uniref:RNase H type-1 domain-containing protein n=1 Tax=Gossypium stocksii TaxID=47602 RepID=A0A9D3WC12_9ROSI|nr:hypothetical protein J1N35_004088 [Gossypium stocksii]